MAALRRGGIVELCQDHPRGLGKIGIRRLEPRPQCTPYRQRVRLEPTLTLLTAAERQRVIRCVP